MKECLFVANWKMYLSLDEMASWCDQYAQKDFGWANHAQIIVCPEPIHMGFVYTALGREIHIGSQDCSAHTNGPFTGEISAAHLAELDIFYTIIGHYERRLYHQETPSQTTAKIITAIKNGLTPIVCVTSSRDAQEIFSDVKLSPEIIICAYEPPKSIGSGLIPETTQINQTCQEIRQTLAKIFPATEIFMLYGGSVSELNVKTFATISEINGLLIGKASTDFQAFKKIVSSFMDRAL